VISCDEKKTGRCAVTGGSVVEKGKKGVIGTQGGAVATHKGVRLSHAR